LGFGEKNLRASFRAHDNQEQSYAKNIQDDADGLDVYFHHILQEVAMSMPSASPVTPSPGMPGSRTCLLHLLDIVSPHYVL
jgi:hypothetical protein